MGLREDMQRLLDMDTDKGTLDGPTAAEFGEELKVLLNEYSKDNEANTSDFILVEYLRNCLGAFVIAMKERDRLGSLDKKPGE